MNLRSSVKIGGRMGEIVTIVNNTAFKLLDAKRKLAEPLCQIREFLSAFKETLSKAFVPGKYLCIDKSINQWLGSGMPMAEKVPLKA
ncbi:hypothetical protein [Parasitella parasitica]|uniref:PiggyBac transposable element-derived protein domain-containing protein n=1 Tax=Parasitella parasitica TaxID=35722 RepID=A0A0B7NKV9_9FUNG|nr:hypothetical protein [Parasitella parasitica]